MKQAVQRPPRLAALVGLADSVLTEDRRIQTHRYLEHLDQSIGRSGFDDLDRTVALHQDRQGLGMSR